MHMQRGILNLKWVSKVVGSPILRLLLREVEKWKVQVKSKVQCDQKGFSISQLLDENLCLCGLPWCGPSFSKEYTFCTTANKTFRYASQT